MKMKRLVMTALLSLVLWTGATVTAQAGNAAREIEENWPEHKLIREEARRMVRNAVSMLPDKMKVTVLLYYMEERSVEQIADILHIPRGTVKSRLHQARKILEKELEYVLNE